MALKAGFVGAGRMGGAMLKGFLKRKMLKPADVVVCDKDASKLKSLPRGVKSAAKPADVASASAVIFLCVKPKDMKELLDEIGGECSGKLLVSVAAGISTKFIEKKAPGARVVRVMPNTPALVGETAAAYCAGRRASAKDLQMVEALFSSLGVILKVDEKHMDAVTGLSGSGPAYVYYVIKALAEAGVGEGMDYDTSLKLAVQTVKGAAVMLSKTGKTPDELIGMVRSPGGTTVEGLRALDEHRASEAFRSAVSSAARRSRELGV